jgi:predicted sugar kinase
MSADALEVIAPSRLHFGLLSFGHPGHPQYGGAGVMIDQPGLRLRISPAASFVASGPLAERVHKVAARFAASRAAGKLPPCRLAVIEGPPEHIGLGTGTQLALSVVAGLNAWCGGNLLEPAQLATLACRAARSAVGTYGFVHGGMILESGKRDCDPLAPRARS